MTRAEFVATTVAQMWAAPNRIFTTISRCIADAIALANALEATPDCPWLTPRPHDPGCAYCVAAPDGICQAHRQQARQERAR